MQREERRAGFDLQLYIKNALYFSIRQYILERQNRSNDLSDLIFLLFLIVYRVFRELRGAYFNYIF